MARRFRVFASSCVASRDTQHSRRSPWSSSDRRVAAATASVDAMAHQVAEASPESRLAYLNDAIKNQQLIKAKRYAPNVIVTSKYTVIKYAYQHGSDYLIWKAIDPFVVCM